MYSKGLLALAIAGISSAAVAWDLPPGDPLYQHQWHLKNTGQNAFAANPGVAGYDLNVEPAHARGIHGVGIYVSIVDDGLDIHHPDLADRIVSGSFNFANGTTDPSPTHFTDAHGTSVAGITGATGWNGIGVRGVAPRVYMNGSNFLASDFDRETYSQGQALVDSLLPSGRNARTRVFNKSFGVTLGWYEVPTANQDFNDNLHRFGYYNGGAGFGSLYIKSAGNGYTHTREPVNFNYYLGQTDEHSVRRNHGLPVKIASEDANNAGFFNTVVSASNAAGKRASYSSTGSAVLFTAPGGEYGADNPAHVTTDPFGCDRGTNRDGNPRNTPLQGGTALDPNCDYNSTMNGTSSAAPNASGVAALIMSANHALSARDVRHIMLSTATPIDLEHPGVPLTFTNADGEVVTYDALPGWQVNGAGMPFHSFYGFGQLNAGAAIDVALMTNSILPPLFESRWVDVADEIVIPDATLEGARFEMPINAEMTVEAIQLELDIVHERPLDLAIELISPAGTRSVLLSPRTGLVGGDGEFTGKRLISHNFYGEQLQGNWTIVARDTSSGDVTAIEFVAATRERPETVLANNTVDGALRNVKMRVYGHQ